MLKKSLVVLAALVALGMVFGEDDDSAGPLGDSAAAGAGDVAGDPESQDKPAADDSGAGEADEDRAGRPASTEGKTDKPAPVTKTEPKPVRTYLVTRVIDGDTIEIANGESVRVVGIDTPERGECGYDEATANLERLVLGKRVRLGRSDEDRDKYDRLLRYVDVGHRDAGLRQIAQGFAIARYDSRDGYGYHPRENTYIATDEATADFTCAKPKPQPVAPAPASQGDCAPGYSPCIPAYPPDLDCADVPGPISVTGSDPHGLDRDGDGIACEDG